MHNRDWILIGALAVGGYLAWRFLSGLKETGEKAIDTISEVIADPLIKWLIPPNVIVTGAAILPNGYKLPFTRLVVQKTPNKEEFYFFFQAKKYILLPRDTKGNYPTKLVA